MIKLGLSIDEGDDMEDENDIPALEKEEVVEDATNKMEDVDWSILN